MDFFFYLDAWQYCHQHKIPLTRIVRKNWKTWTVALATEGKYGAV